MAAAVWRRLHARGADRPVEGALSTEHAHGACLPHGSRQPQHPRLASAQPHPVWPRSDAVRGLAKAKASAAELAAACVGAPDEATTKAGSSGRAAEMLAAFEAFRDEVAALAAAGAPAGAVLAACDR